MNRNDFKAFLPIIILSLSTGCKRPAVSADLPAGIPVDLAPKDNPFSPEKAVLGRFLFYDKRISGDETMACASCHSISLSLTDQKAIPKGIPSGTGTPLPRSAPNLTNAGFTKSYTWINPGLTLLEAQALVPLFLDNVAIELGLAGRESEALDRLRKVDYYQEMFKTAFPDDKDPFTIVNVVRAIASFERTFVSFDAPFDRFEKGDRSALNPRAQRGREIFFSEQAKCSQCHSGRFFSDAQDPAASPTDYLHNNGIHASYPDASANMGLAEITHQKSDSGKFKTPTLRNVALTYPFMHDGSITCDASLQKQPGVYSEACARQALGRVIDNYAGGGKKNQFQDKRVSGFELKPVDREALTEFLLSLTDQSFLSRPFYQTPRPGDSHFVQ